MLIIELIEEQDEYEVEEACNGCEWEEDEEGCPEGIEGEDEDKEEDIDDGGQDVHGGSLMVYQA